VREEKKKRKGGKEGRGRSIRPFFFLTFICRKLPSLLVRSCRGVGDRRDDPLSIFAHFAHRLPRVGRKEKEGKKKKGREGGEEDDVCTPSTPLLIFLIPRNLVFDPVAADHKKRGKKARKGGEKRKWHALLRFDPVFPYLGGR